MPNKQQKEERVGIKEFIAFLEKKKAEYADRELKVMIASHTQTDADAAASAYAIDKLIKGIMKEQVSTTVVLDDSRTPDLQRILEQETTRMEFKFTPLSEMDPTYKPDLLVYVDCQPDPKRVALPSKLDLNGIDSIIIDHHEKKNPNAALSLIDENYKSNIALIYDSFLREYTDYQFTPVLGMMCLQAAKRDTANFSMATERDFEAFKAMIQHVKKEEFNQFLSLDDLLLTPTQLQTYASGLSQNRTIENFCKFSLIPGLITADEHIAAVMCADFLYNQTKPIDIPNAIVATIESNDAGNKSVTVTVRGEECKKVAEIFGGSGRKDMAAAQIPICAMFEKAIKTPFFKELIEKELELRIMGSYMNKSDNKPEPKKSLIETTEVPLEEKLRDNDLNPENMTLIARGLEYNSARQNIRSFFVHNLATKPYGGAISEEQLNIMTSLVHQFQKFKGNDVSIVYSLVNGSTGMYVLALIESENGVKHNAKYVATELMGENAIDSKLSKGDDYVVAKVDIDFCKYTWGDDLLSKCVYVAFEEKLEELFNQSQHSESIYLKWKKEHKW